MTMLCHIQIGVKRMSKQKLEKVLELMINEENDKASDLLHEIFVEKARKIYSNMIKEDEDLERDLNEADWDKEYDFDTSDAEDDFEKDADEFDVSDLDDEIDNEEMYEADDEFADEDEVDPEFDLADEMSGDEDMEASDEELSDLDGDSGSVDTEEVFMNVEDALAELKAAFADIVGNAGETDEVEDEGEDEFDSADYDYESDEEESDEFEDEGEEIKESVKLSKVSAPKKVADEGKTSPFAKVKDSDKLGKPLKNALKSTTETGGKPTKAKPIGVPGPQDIGSKLKPASVRKAKA